MLLAINLGYLENESVAHLAISRFQLQLIQFVY